MRMSLEPIEAESLRATGGIEPAFCVYTESIDREHRLIVVETARRWYHWAIMGPVGVDRMSVDPAPLMITAMMIGRQAVKDFEREQEQHRQEVGQ